MTLAKITLVDFNRELQVNGWHESDKVEMMSRGELKLTKWKGAVLEMLLRMKMPDEKEN